MMQVRAVMRHRVSPSLMAPTAQRTASFAASDPSTPTRMLCCAMSRADARLRHRCVSSVQDAPREGAFGLPGHIAALRVLMPVCPDWHGCFSVQV